MRFILPLLILLASANVRAEKLTLERLYADPPLSGPRVRSLKVSPDGARVTFLRGREDNRYRSPARLVASGDVLDPQISPQGRYLSFVRDQNLAVIDLATGKERLLTTDGAGTVHDGEAEFVAQEEMLQTSGYYWAPDDSAIAYKRYDEAPVPVVRRFEIFADRTDVVEQRYPAAGDPNVLVQLKIVSPVTGEQRSVDLGSNPDIYLLRADWSANGNLCAQARRQQCGQAGAHHRRRWLARISVRAQRHLVRRRVGQA
jgi:dipeptidyl aminopeptidase/acylaminoacyl peptidase